jgi:3-hydroxyacyl-CoA dehydrogenase
MEVQIDKAVVVGSGIMGHGICQLMAQKGIEVSLVDVSEELLEQARGWIKGNLEYQASMGDLDQGQVADIMGRISIQHRSGLLPAGRKMHVIEAVSEDVGIKQQVWQIISDNADPKAILASNTSSYEINDRWPRGGEP